MPTNGHHPAQHVPEAAAAMTPANPATPAAEGPLGTTTTSSSGTNVTSGARSGLRRYLSSVPTYQQAAASMPRKKNSSGSLMAEESASLGTRPRSSSIGGSSGGQYGGVVLPRLANLASVPTASAPDHPSVSARFYNPWLRSNGGGARMRRGTGRMMSMSSSSSTSFGAQRGIGGWVASGSSRSRRRIVLPALVLLLVGWYAMGSGIGGGGGGDGTNVSTLRSDDVALTHNATLTTSLVGMRTKRQSGDDHDSSDEGAVVATVAKTRRR